MSIIVKTQDENLIVSFSYSPDRVEKIKTIKGRSYDSKSKSWLIPNKHENIESLMRFFLGK